MELKVGDKIRITEWLGEYGYDHVAEITHIDDGAIAFEPAIIEEVDPYSITTGVMYDVLIEKGDIVLTKESD